MQEASRPENDQTFLARRAKDARDEARRQAREDELFKQGTTSGKAGSTEANDKTVEAEKKEGASTSGATQASDRARDQP